MRSRLPPLGVHDRRHAREGVWGVNELAGCRNRQLPLMFTVLAVMKSPLGAFGLRPGQMQIIDPRPVHFLPRRIDHLRQPRRRGDRQRLQSRPRRAASARAQPHMSAQRKAPLTEESSQVGGALRGWTGEWA